MENKDLHDRIKYRLNDYESPMDLDLEWKAFSKKRNRRKALIWLFLLIGLLCCISIGYFVLQLESDNDLVPNRIEAGKETIEVDRKREVLDHNINLQRPKNAAVLDKERLEIDSAIPEKKKGNIALDNFDRTTIDPSQNRISSKYKMTKHEVVASKKNKTPLLEKGVSVTAESSLNSTKKEHLVGSATKEKVANLEQGKLNFNVLNIGNSFPDLSYSNHDLDFTQLLLPQKAKQEQDLNQRRIEIYTGAGLYYSQQIFEAKKEADQAYAALRQSSETNLESYNVDLGVNYFLSQKSFIGLGLSYSEWYDRLNYTYEKTKTYELENVLVKFIKYRPSGYIEEIYGDTTVIGTQTIKNTRFNQYTSISANLNFGYYFSQKNKFSVGTSGGLIWNFSTQSNGTITSPISSEIERKNDNYKKSFGLGLNVNVHLDYQLNQKWAIQLRPGANYFISSITAKDDVLTSRFYQFGVLLGIKYKL